MEKEADGPINVIRVELSVSDDDAAKLCSSSENDVVAVDIPFAWPKYFADFVSRWRPVDGDHISIEKIKIPDSADFQYRTTDKCVRKRTGKWPLPVSSNLFALGARKWAGVVHSGGLRSRIVVTKPSPSDVPKPRIIEVYPGATLKAFENDSSQSISGQRTRIDKAGKKKKCSYKKCEGTRRVLVEQLLTTFQIVADQEKKSRLVDSGERDHATDAFLAAITGLIFLNEIDMWRIIEPDGSQIEDARIEGWIFFPEKSQEAGDS